MVIDNKEQRGLIPPHMYFPIDERDRGKYLRGSAFSKRQEDYQLDEGIVMLMIIASQWNESHRLRESRLSAVPTQA